MIEYSSLIWPPVALYRAGSLRPMLNTGVDWKLGGKPFRVFLGQVKDQFGGSHQPFLFIIMNGKAETIDGVGSRLSDYSRSVWWDSFDAAQKKQSGFFDLESALEEAGGGIEVDLPPGSKEGSVPGAYIPANETAPSESSAGFTLAGMSPAVLLAIGAGVLLIFGSGRKK